ncbi:unnamed protein product [Lota lota]
MVKLPTMVYVSNNSGSVLLESHYFSLGSQRPLYVVVERVFFEVQLAAADSQSMGGIPSRGQNQPMSE